MAPLQLQAFVNGRWRDCATLTFDRPEAGVGSPSQLDYDVDYFVQMASADNLQGEVGDLRAVSVRVPVDLATHRSERWLPFVLDLIPQGAMRRRFAAKRNWRDSDPRLDHLLLLHGAGSPVGNLRVLEARQADEEKLKNEQSLGVSIENILALDDAFMEVWEKAELTAGGSEGLQGDWPKILMTRHRDSLWRPDAEVADADAIDHVLVKRAHPKADYNSAVLKAEAGYLELARRFGLRVGKALTIGRDVAIIPRFDRAVTRDGLMRIGQESLASAIGASEFGAREPHTKYLAAIRAYSTAPQDDVIEYVLRDVLNLAAGNTDNHGRNTAFQKFPDGRIELAPLFDFAPMTLVQEGPRVTRWNDVTTDHAPDWVAVAHAACGDGLDPEPLLAILKQSEGFIRALPQQARAVGIDDDVIASAMGRHSEIADTLAAIPSRKPSP